MKGEGLNLNELQRNIACKKQVGLKRAKIIRERQERWEENKREGGSAVGGRGRLCSAKIKTLRVKNKEKCLATSERFKAALQLGAPVEIRTEHRRLRWNYGNVAADLQWAMMGPASGGLQVFTLRRKARKGVGYSGTPWSGHAVNWNWRTSRFSLEPFCSTTRSNLVWVFSFFDFDAVDSRPERL